VTPSEHAQLSTIVGSWEIAAVALPNGEQKISLSHAREVREFLRERADTEDPEPESEAPILPPIGHPGPLPTIDEDA
jgi:hypothetical protein